MTSIPSSTSLVTPSLTSQSTGLITPSTGLITGIPIQDTVDQLMAVASQSKNILTSRTQDLTNEKTAVTQLETLIAAFQYEANAIGTASLFQTRQATSNDAALTAAVATDGSPAPGSYLFTPVQTASTQQLLSQSFASTDKIGAGSFTFGVGGFVDKGISLDQLNGGTGVRGGKIRITDRSGASAVIDLSYARSIDDVLDAINNNTSINVTAAVSGDSLQLLDNSGGSGNLKVQEVSGGSTATDLGLAGIDVAASTATGSDVFTLSANSKLSSLNDETGIQLRSGDELSITLADGSTVNVDLGDASTLGGVIDAINAAAPTKLSAAIGGDGNRLQLTDLTTGASTFAVTDVGGGTAADDLGLTVASAGGTITGARLASGLRDTLVSSMNGGKGLGTLGDVDITNRNGDTSHIDLSGAETLGQIVSAINAQAVGVTASINAARNGIVLSDTTGGTTSNFIVADGDATDSASKLGLIADGTATSVNSGALNRQQVSAATLLSSLNGGAGIQVGDFKITGTTGVLGAVDLNQVDNVATTVGDVIDRINALVGVGVQARINDRGDGIELVDTFGGPGSITVTEVGNGTTAKDLNLVGTSTLADVDGVQKQVIDGSTTTTVTITADDTLSTLVSKINALNRGVTASVLNDGKRQRLSLTANESGASNELLIDTSDTSLSFQEISGGRDALLLYGSSGGGGALLSSSSNTFENVVNGLNVTVNNGTLAPVTVNVSTSTDSLVATAKQFVSAYNSLRTTLDKLTAYDPTAQTTGLLFGTTEALQVDTDLTQLITSPYYGLGQFQSLTSVGITLDDSGQMVLDDAKLTAAFQKDPDAVTKLFTDSASGVGAKLNAACERLASTSNSLLSNRVDSLTSIIDANNRRIDQMTDRLNAQRDALLAQFNNLESVVASLKSNASALSTYTPIPPINSVRATTVV
ncbi:MAG TPA: flagellar filament capping protein FliD [Lacipirellulaceae bacterium]|nr:flagellar filament capping protein FliD [Lacipirellulaceae bacterium]